jgi:5'-3' exoribonuclease 2
VGYMYETYVDNTNIVSSKIMNFVRSQRSMPTHDPNTSHVIYGLDADLIMLSLATHEPHFRVLREDVFFDSGKDKVCTRCGRKGHIRTNCEFPDDGQKLTAEEADEEWATSEHQLKPYIWLHTNILREYLAVEMETPKRTFKYDLERSLDEVTSSWYKLSVSLKVHASKTSELPHGGQLGA